MLFYIVVFFISFILTLIVTPQIKKLAIRLKAFDNPNKRKIHQRPIPRLGGLSLFIVFLLSIGIVYSLFHLFGVNISQKEILPAGGIIMGSIVVVMIGIMDDIYGVNVAIKFTGQIIAAMVAIFCGAQVYFVATPFNTLFYLGVWAIPFTLIWIVGITNAVNLIDGLDGLAAGISGIAAVTLFIVAIGTGQLSAAFISIMVAGMSFGFLPYNFYPASIFLGDSGSLFLGFMLATLSVVGVLKSTLVIAFIIPVFILGIPIYDTTTVIISRVRARKQIFMADKRHFHHRLLRAGFSQKEAVIIIYIACALLSTAALIATTFNNYQNIIVLSLIVIIGILGIDLAKDILRRSTQIQVSPKDIFFRAGKKK